jgi:hypothetical protein
MLLVLGLGTLSLLNISAPSALLDERGGRRTWTVRSGDTAMLSANETRDADRYSCEVDGGTYTVNGTPRPAERAVAGDFTVSTAEDGTVTLRCAT